MNGQRGVALVTALLIVSLASIIAVSMVQRMQLDIRRTGNLLAVERGYQYARGLELWAIEALRLDAQESAGRDSYVEPWASELPVITLDEGRLTGRMTDLDGRFNLNNLVLDGVRQSARIAQFERLLTALALDPAIARRCVDWIDADSTNERDGAEDDSYGRRQPPYRAANAPFVDLSELRLIDGVTPPVFDALEPHVSVLPAASQVTPINVNTATVPVLMSIDALITRPVAESLFQNGRANFESINAFLNHSELRPFQQTLITYFQQQTLSLDSQHFLARGLIEIDGRTRRFQSLIVQLGNRFTVRWRAPERYSRGYSVAAQQSG
ncbi:MAG: type II secretion system minor pseudopilin GspK [Pseudomonadota bacterium]